MWSNSLRTVKHPEDFELYLQPIPYVLQYSTHSTNRILVSERGDMLSFRYSFSLHFLGPWRLTVLVGRKGRDPVDATHVGQQVVVGSR